MKANRFIVESEDEAVSPVIAVILMVAITVVLAATVYVWVSGFGTSGSIKKFPQVTLKDETTNDPGASGNANGAFAVLEHRGGDTLNWADYTTKVFVAGTEQSGVRFSSTLSSGDCGGTPTEDPSGSWSVGNKLYLCDTAASMLVTDDDEILVQIIDQNQNSIVYENTVVVS